ncbi:hypothetical protein LG293_15930 (plasmid) [Citricoccus nitrophenolicus]
MTEMKPMPHFVPRIWDNGLDGTLYADNPKDRMYPINVAYEVLIRRFGEVELAWHAENTRANALEAVLEGRDEDAAVEFERAAVFARFDALPDAFGFSEH